MKFLLDTTYLLPVIGISVRELPKDAPIKLISKGHRIFISDVSIFELSAKGAKHVSKGALPPERVTKGIGAMIYDERIEMIPIHDSKLLLTAFKLRNMLSDFIDCIILSSAMNRCDALITEDDDIQNLEKNNEYKELVKATNPKFKIQALTKTL
jgi:PIN domain nuclease of toxin-antitoxin system